MNRLLSTDHDIPHILTADTPLRNYAFTRVPTRTDIIRRLHNVSQIVKKASGSYMKFHIKYNLLEGILETKDISSQSLRLEIYGHALHQTHQEGDLKVYKNWKRIQYVPVHTWEGCTLKSSFLSECSFHRWPVHLYNKTLSDPVCLLNANWASQPQRTMRDMCQVWSYSFQTAGDNLQ